MLRTSRTTSTTNMGLLEGLQTLQGAPPPSSTPSTTSVANDTPSQLNNLTTSARAALDNFNESAKSSATSLRRFLGDESVDLEAPPPSLSDELAATFNLTLIQRISLFAMIFGTGIVLLVLSFSFLPLIVVVPHKFAAAFTLGNLLAISSTWVLVGPRAQLQSMFQPVRAAAAGVYVLSMFIALGAAFFGGRWRYLFVLPAIIMEVLALGWYALSYIPYGRQMLTRFLTMMGISS